MREQPTIAFIGLGNMGFPMVSRLIAADWGVRGFDVSAEARGRLDGIGASAHSSASDAVRGADIVILMLPSSAIVTAVVEQLVADGALPESGIVVDMSSSEPLATRALSETLAASGVSLVDAPVSGGVKGAESGKLTIMVGGDDGAVERVASVLETVGRSVRCGAVGAGHAIKALNNLLSATHLWATSEAMEAGAAFGLDPEVMLSVFNASSGRSGSTENKWPNFVLPSTYDSGFGLALMLKDMKIAIGLARSTQSPTAITLRAVELWEQAAEGLPASADHTEIARWVAAIPGGNRSTAAPDPWSD